MAAFAAALVSCNSGNDNNTEDDATRNVTPGIQNVNGNMPDTSNAISLSTSDSVARHEVDSLSDDTATKRTNRKK